MTTRRPAHFLEGVYVSYPLRPIFGKVRWMTSDSTRKKLKLKAYLDKYAE